MKSLKNIISYNDCCCFLLKNNGLALFNYKDYNKTEFKSEQLKIEFVKKIKDKKIFIGQRDTEKPFFTSLEQIKTILQGDESVYITITPYGMETNKVKKFYNDWVALGLETFTGAKFYLGGEKSKKELDNQNMYKIGLWTDSWEVYSKINIANPDNQLKFYKQENFNTNFASLRLNKKEIITFFEGSGQTNLEHVEDKNSILFGTNQVKIAISDLFKHLFICSKTGQGKSELLLYLMALIKDKGANFLLIDPKSSTALKAQKLFNQETKEGLSFNPLALRLSKDELGKYAETLTDLLLKNDTTYLKLYFNYSLAFALQYNQKQVKKEDYLNFKKLYDVLRDNPSGSKYLKFASYVPFKALCDMLTDKDSQKQNTAVFGAFLARFQFLANSTELNNQELGFDFDGDNFVALPKINMTMMNGINDITTQVLVLAFWYDVLIKSKQRKKEGKWTFLIIEEASTVNLSFFARMLATIREENVSIILVSQYANQLIKEIQNSILDNISTYFCGYTGVNNANFMAKALRISEDEILRLDDGSYEFLLGYKGRIIKTKAVLEGENNPE
jgi:hypothetical protein